MLIENDTYKVKIVRDETFTLDSTDNKPYQFIFNPNNIKRSDYYKTFSISIDDGNNQKHIALIGSLFGADEDVVILEGNDLIVLMNTKLVIIDCRALTIKLCREISDFGTYFSIHKFEDGYLIYGELDLLKLSPAFEVEWSFSGEDIFVSQDGSIPFHFENDTIYLSDWKGRKYKLNKFGEEITQQSN